MPEVAGSMGEQWVCRVCGRVVCMQAVVAPALWVEGRHFLCSDRDSGVRSWGAFLITCRPSLLLPNRGGAQTVQTVDDGSLG